MAWPACAGLLARGRAARRLPRCGAGLGEDVSEGAAALRHQQGVSVAVPICVALGSHRVLILTG